MTTDTGTMDTDTAAPTTTQAWERIRSTIARGDQAQAEADASYREAGRLLILMREQTAHGDWLPTLEREKIDERQARRLMELFKSDAGVRFTDVCHPERRQLFCAHGSYQAVCDQCCKHGRPQHTCIDCRDKVPPVGVKQMVLRGAPEAATQDEADTTGADMVIGHLERTWDRIEGIKLTPAQRARIQVLTNRILEVLDPPEPDVMREAEDAMSA